MATTYGQESGASAESEASENEGAQPPSEQEVKEPPCRQAWPVSKEL